MKTEVLTECRQLQDQAAAEAACRKLQFGTQVSDEGPGDKLLHSVYSGFRNFQEAQSILWELGLKYLFQTLHLQETLYSYCCASPVTLRKHSLMLGRLLT